LIFAVPNTFLLGKTCQEKSTGLNLTCSGNESSFD
jgi:hypothetical protein